MNIFLISYSNNYECPIKYNPADYYIEILALKSNNRNNYLNIQVNVLFASANVLFQFTILLIFKRHYAILMRKASITKKR